MDNEPDHSSKLPQAEEAIVCSLAWISIYYLADLKETEQAIKKEKKTNLRSSKREL